MEKSKIKVKREFSIVIKTGNVLLLSDLNNLKVAGLDAHVTSIYKKESFVKYAAGEWHNADGYWTNNWHADGFYWEEETDSELLLRIAAEEKEEAYRLRLKHSEEAQEKLTYLRLKEKYEPRSEN